MRRTLLTAILALTAAAVPAGGARADSITIAAGTLTYTGLPTESSSPFIDVNTISGVLEFDAGFGRTIAFPAPQCSGGPRFVDCQPAGVMRVAVNLGSKDDSVLASFFPLSLTINAGDGNDTVTGGTAADVINGQGGADTLLGDGVFGGAASHDDLDGGPGDDLLRGMEGRDVLRGGDGIDTAYYRDRPATQPVKISLDGVANDGADGESDNVVSDVEVLQGGLGADVLTSDNGASILRGDAGADTLTGGGGVDEFEAGEGADTLDAFDGRSENVNCGGDGDRAAVDLFDILSNCEDVSASGLLQVDADGDGLDDPLDCDDLNAAIRPGALDVLDNGVDEDCSGADAVNLDRDGDGASRPADCDDANTRIRPGARDVRGNAVDEDCENGAAPYLRVRAAIVNAWAVFAAHTEVRRLTIRPTGDGKARALVLCRGRSCPFARRSFTVRGPLDLRRPFRGRALAPGTTIELRVLREGMIGKVVRYRIRDERAPATSALCLPPKSDRPKDC